MRTYYLVTYRLYTSADIWQCRAPSLEGAKERLLAKARSASDYDRAELYQGDYYRQRVPPRHPVQLYAWVDGERWVEC